MVLGVIDPPLEDCEYEYMGQGPKYRENVVISVEENEISCEAAKIKMLWGERDKIIDEDGNVVEDEESEEEMKIAKEAEEEMRRIWDLPQKVLDMSLWKVTDAGDFSRRTFFPDEG